jgi:UDP-N-acetylmuramoyl-tripeptide--D-alanyl-D-alanine ligase
LLAYVEARTVITFGSEIDADLIAGPVTVETTKTIDGSETIGIVFTVGGDRRIHLPLLGSHNARNAAAAIAVAEQLEVSPKDAIAGLANATIPGMRFELRTIAGIRVINDAYNANPDSMACAIDASITIPRTGRLVLILGDMLELGEHANDAHRRIGALVAGLETPTALLTIGPDARQIAAICREAPMVEAVESLPDWTDESIERAVGMLAPGDTVLLKASRGVQLERIVDRLIAQDLDPTAAHHTSSAG